MASMAYDTVPVRPDGFTVDDLAEMPNDGRRYELLDGVLLVSPSPRWAHQEVLRALTSLLHAALPPELRVVPAPFEWRHGLHTALQPDILVTRYDALVAVPDSTHLEEPPLLAVEVLSPSSRRIDRFSKMAAYEDAGVVSYWLIEPDPREPSLTALELSGGRYTRVARVVGEETWTAGQPFPITIRPAELVRGLRP